jgi:hypothetical protein
LIQPFLAIAPHKPLPLPSPILSKIDDAQRRHFSYGPEEDRPFFLIETMWQMLLFQSNMNRAAFLIMLSCGHANIIGKIHKH